MEYYKIETYFLLLIRLILNPPLFNTYEHILSQDGETNNAWIKECKSKLDIMIWLISGTVYRMNIGEGTHVDYHSFSYNTELILPWWTKYFYTKPA